MIYDEKNRASLTRGGPVFMMGKKIISVSRQWNCMNNDLSC